MIIHVLNRAEELVTILHNDDDLSGIINFRITEDLAETDTLEFEVSGTADGVDQLIEGNYIVTKNLAGKFRQFVITRVVDNHSEGNTKVIYAEDAIIELGDFNAGVVFEGNIDLKTTATALVKGTTYTVGDIDQPLLPMNITATNKYSSKLSVLNTVVTASGLNLFTTVDITDNSEIVKKLHITEFNKDEGRRFEFDSDLSTIQRDIDASTIKTAIIPIGAAIEQSEEDQAAGKPVEYVTITGVSWSTANGDPLNKPMGEEVLIHPEATAKYGIKGANGAMQPKVIVVQFSEIADPKELLIAAYSKLNTLIEPSISYNFTANDLTAQLKAMGITEEPLELGDVACVIDNSVTPPIAVEVVVRRLEGNPFTPEEMSIEIGEPLPTLVDESVSQQIENALSSGAGGSGFFTDLTAIKADIHYLKANKAEIKDLEAISIKTETLSATVAEIGTLVNGNLTSSNIQAGSITGDKLNMNTITVTNANIESLAASKITAGTINTSQIDISSESGGVRIADNTMQFKDGADNVRVQIGEDSKGDFSFLLVGADGKGVLLDQNGLKEGALSSGIVKEDHIGAGAVSGNKINWVDFVSEWNKDTNTNTLKASRVVLDGTGQKLNVSFTQMDSTLTGVKETVDSHTTELNIEKGKINTLIADTTIIKDGQSLKLKDEYSKLEQTVGGIKTTVGTHTSEITGLNTKVATNISSINQLKDQIVLKVEKTEVETTVKDAVANVQVGGRNLLIGGKFGSYQPYNVINSQEGSEKIVSTFNANWSGSVFTLDNNSSSVNGVHTISGFIKVNNAIPATKFFTGLINSYGSDLLENYYDNTTGYFRITQTFKSQLNLIIHGNTSRKGYAADVVELSHLKLERGNKATDWTPAPEDVSNEITDKVTAAKSEIKQTTDAIALNVSNLQTTTSTLTTQMGDKASKAEVKTISDKAAALEVNMNSISSKVSSVESSVTTIDGKIVEHNDRITSAEQKITADAIVNTVVSSNVTSSGRMLYTDPTFLYGVNSIYAYNNNVNGVVVINRIAKPADCPSSSTHALEIKTTSTGAAPGNGGFHWAHPSRANTTFLYKFTAKVPSGLRIDFATNSTGDGSTGGWVTSNLGTGTYKEYVYKRTCGSTGVFGNTGYFYLGNGTPPITWYLASATVYDLGDNQDLAKELSSTITGGAVLNTVSTRLDKDGFTVNNGAIRITNKAGQTVLSGDTNGNLTVTGTINGSTINGSTINGSSVNATAMTVNDTLNLKPKSLDFPTEMVLHNPKGISYGSGVIQYTNGNTLSLSSGGNITLRSQGSVGMDITGGWVYPSRGVEASYLTAKAELTSRAATTNLDAKLLRFQTPSGVEHTLFGYDMNALRMHRYDTGGSWSTCFHFKNNGDLFAGSVKFTTSQDNTVRDFKRSTTSATGYMHVTCNDGARGIDWWNSDLKLKHTVVPLDNGSFKIPKERLASKQLKRAVSALGVINAIEHFSFMKKEGEYSEDISCGYVAQQLQQVNPEFVFEVEQPPTLTDYVDMDSAPIEVPNPLYFEEDPVIRNPRASAILPYVTKAIQEQQVIIEAQQTAINSLEARLAALEAKLAGVQ